MPDSGFNPEAVDMSTADTPNVGDTTSQSKPQPAWAAALEAGHARRRIASQRAVVAVLRAQVNAAIAARDNEAGEAAHAALMRAELRLHRMEGLPVCAADGVVVGRAG